MMPILHAVSVLMGFRAPLSVINSSLLFFNASVILLRQSVLTLRNI